MATKLDSQRSFLGLTTDALRFAVTTALRLVDSHKDLPEFSLDQVSWHDHINDCWIIVNDRVYDITSFLQEHPGGDSILLEYAGRDATLAFNGTGHSAQAWRALEKYLVGQLPPHERLFKSKANESPPFGNTLALSASG